MPDLFDKTLIKTFQKDKKYLEETKVPIITVSSTFHEDVKRWHGLPNNNTARDTVFSRAHYSMALGVAITAWQKTNQSFQHKTSKPDPSQAWLADPTNYVSTNQLLSISLTETIGKTLARYDFLKKLKDLVDRFGRQKLPILKSITPPLMFLTQNIKKPILSMHIAAGNILLDQGKKVVQVITDPHVREEYLQHASNPNAYFCVFDEATKLEFLEKATINQIVTDQNRIVVTGPPIDPRIISSRLKKTPWRNGPIKLCITTGGLGTNKKEILSILKQLLPQMRKKPTPFNLLVYCGTHQDIHQEVLNIAKYSRISVSSIDDKKSRFRVIYHPQIFDANELLIKYGFPWADGFMSKPSGDMAYDAIASGSFLLSLNEWGEWEEQIRAIFEQKEVSRQAITDSIVGQLQVLSNTSGKAQSWIEKAMLNTRSINKLYLEGSINILRVVKKLS